jgi:hypothetical protein
MTMRALALLIVLLSSSAANAATARVWIAEFATARAQAAAPFAVLPALTVQPVLDISLTRQVSLLFSGQTKYIRVVCEVQCTIRAGGNPTVNDILLPALKPEYFGVAPGSTISVVAAP